VTSRAAPRTQITDPTEARRIAATFPSYRDFVDAALFDPEWGYYSTGQVRFGEGGHYDTFPIALAPMFGRMVVQYAFRLWRRAGEPRSFEVCELGAGNGQLCLDALVWLLERARRDKGWRRFAARVRYRIVERSPALVARQRAQLGPLAPRVTWTRADLAQRPARGTPFAGHGLVVANEVLDCLAHHQIVRQADGSPGVVFVIPEVAADADLDGRGVTLVRGVGGVCNAVTPADLGTVLRDERWHPHLSFREVTLPVQMVPDLHLFLWWYYPEFFTPGHRFKPYFACPGIEAMVRHTARLYRHPVVMWIDYGDGRDFHLTAPVSQRVFAGPPRSGASVYDAPGADDITFMVDFSVVAGAAQRAGLRVAFYGGQKELARRSGTRFTADTEDLILHHRMLEWVLAVVGVGPERAWRHTSLTWTKGRGGRLRADVRRAVGEFTGRYGSDFQLMLLR